MRSLLITVGIAGLLLGLAGSSMAQQNERIYPIVELTDEDLARIDIKDGTIADWEEVVGDATLTALEFRTDLEAAPHGYDPVSMDFRIWLAWHDATNRIYGAMERADDMYINTLENEDLRSRHDSSIIFYVDGDQSGERFQVFRTDLSWHRQAQGYTAIAEVYGGRTPVGMIISELVSKSLWFQTPPYADGGGGVFGEKPTLTITEFYVTPFDLFVYNSPGESVVSELYPGKTISFAVSVPDIEPERIRDSVHYLLAADISEDCGGWGMYPQCSDSFVNGLLLGTGDEMPGDSAVERTTWGRIKAQFAE